MSNKELTLTLAVIIVILSGLLTTRMGVEFMPNLDEGDIALHAIRIPGTSLTTAIEMQNELEKTIKTFPEVDRVFGKIGTAEIATDPMPPNVADIFIILKPKSEWAGQHHNKEELIKSIEQKIQKIPGNKYEFTQPIEMRFNELLSGVRADVAVKVFGDNLDTLLSLGNKIESILATIPGAADVRTEQISGLPVLSIQVDRAKIARYGLNVADVQDALAISVGGIHAGTIYDGDRRFSLQVRLPESIRSNIEALKRLPIKLPDIVKEAPGTLMNTQSAYVTLGEVADLKLAPRPNQVSRENGKRRVVVTANVRGRDLGSFVNEADTIISDELQLPSGYWITWGGQFEQLVSAAQRLQIVVPLALGLIFVLTLRNVPELSGRAAYIYRSPVCSHRWINCSVVT